MPELVERLQHEQLFHDEQARSRHTYFSQDEARYRFADADYLDHESWVRGAMDSLGDVHGKQLLDLGCGHGMASVVLARRGATVTACDLSAEYVREAITRAAANTVSITGAITPAENLPFPAKSFDAIWGHAILHHLDLPVAAAELRRVLRPGGVAVFCEPWGGNQLLEWTRAGLPYTGKHRTVDEQPLTHERLAPIHEQFSRVTCEGHQLFTMVRRVLPLPLGFCQWERKWLTDRPKLENWCRYMVIRLEG
ncbi:MAG: class I SAM-dependent methyltransferase [Gemmataceae bacterium]